MGVMMDTYKVDTYKVVTSKDAYFDGDIEKGEVNVKLDSSKEGVVFGSSYYNRMLGMHYEGSNNFVKHEERVVSSVGSSCDDDDDDSENVKLIVVDKKFVEERNNGDVERKMVKEKPKAMSAKKPPKPPRPPRGLSLDSADQKLIRELHELAKLKRARVERMKAMKKAKESKSTSSKNQLFATLLTILFCVVLLLQGISSRTSTSVSSQGSHMSPELAQHNLISVQHYPVSSTVGINGPGSESPRFVEQVSGVDTTEQVGRAVG